MLEDLISYVSHWRGLSLDPINLIWAGVAGIVYYIITRRSS